MFRPSKILRVGALYPGLFASHSDLIRSEKLALAGRITRGIAHEIRNPLTNLLMSAGELSKSAGLEHLPARHLDIIARNAERINDLLAQLLDCARPPKLQPRPRDVHEALRNVLQLYRGKIERQRIEVVRRFTRRPAKIMADAEHIERAFSNMILNAIEAMSQGGILTVATERTESSFRVRIEDTGEGIHGEALSRIFEPFFSSKPGRTGLGLAAAYGIVAGHGGTIEVESRHGKGSAFTTSLPIQGKKEGSGSRPNP